MGCASLLTLSHHLASLGHPRYIAIQALFVLLLVPAPVVMILHCCEPQ